MWLAKKRFQKRLCLPSLRMRWENKVVHNVHRVLGDCSRFHNFRTYDPRLYADVFQQENLHRLRPNDSRQRLQINNLTKGSSGFATRFAFRKRAEPNRYCHEKQSAYKKPNPPSYVCRKQRGTY
jgi:hypothetical protein